MMNSPHPLCSCGNDGLCTTSGAVLLATVLFHQKVEKGDFEKSSRGRKCKTKQNTEKALSTVCIYWLISLDPLILESFRSSFTLNDNDEKCHTVSRDIR